MSHLARLGRWVARTTHESLPEGTLLAARYQVLDMIAAVHASARSAEARGAAAAVPRFAGAGRATVLATGDRLGPADAALANAIFSMAQDFDDIVWMGHTCHSSVFAPLAVAEHEGRSARDLLTAVVIANEIGGRLGASSALGPLNGQMWTFIHLVGAAAGAARLLELDAEKVTHALAISLAQPPFALQPGFLSPTSKLLAAATPTAIGVQAAYFAQAGMTGAADILEDRRGFWRRFSYLPLPFMLDGLGELWVTQTLSVKTYPGCHYFQTACSAIEEIVRRTGRLSLDGVRAVTIDTTKLGVEVSRFGTSYADPRGPVTAVSASFDLATVAAILLHAGRFTGDELAPEWLAAETAGIRRWRDKIVVRHDPVLTARVLASARAVSTGRRGLSSLTPRALLDLARKYRAEYASTLLTPREAAGWLRAAVARRRPPPSAGDAVPLCFPGRVTVELASGRRETAELDLPVGSFAAPGMAAELERKVRREVGGSLGPSRAGAVWEAGLALPATPLARLVELASTSGRETAPAAARAGQS
jgi:2-methylcitrate dehydratase PrpD